MTVISRAWCSNELGTRDLCPSLPINLSLGVYSSLLEVVYTMSCDVLLNASKPPEVHSVRLEDGSTRRGCFVDKRGFGAGFRRSRSSRQARGVNGAQIRREEADR